MDYADLHAHTTASDGSLTPTQLVHAAKDAGLFLLAVTDHDTVAGLAEAAEAARAIGIRLLPGVELSAEGAPGKCHLLGLGIDPHNETLQTTLAELSVNRRARNARMIERLQALGVAITLDEVVQAAPPGANVGRPHFAQVLLERRVVTSLPEAFDRFLGDDAPAYVEKVTLSPADAIALVHQANGKAFWAHPGLTRLGQHETHETRVGALKNVGLDGLEAYYPAYTPVETEKFVRLAQKLGLLVTGGSDFHGAPKPYTALGRVIDGQPLPRESVRWVEAYL